MAGRILLIICLLFYGVAGNCALEPVVFKQAEMVTPVEKWGLFKDSSGGMSVYQVLHRSFEIRSSGSLGLSDRTYWVQFSVTNKSALDSICVLVENPTLSQLMFYTVINGTVTDSLQSGQLFLVDDQHTPTTNFAYRMGLQPGNTATVLMRVQSTAPLHLPIFLSSKDGLLSREITNNFMFGIYFGIILIMVLYHIFISFTVDDANYIYYIFFIFFVGAAQVVLRGYGAKYLWAGHPVLAVDSINLSGILSGIATALFVRNFLQTKRVAIGIDRVLLMAIIGYCVAAVVHFLGYRYYAFNLINAIAVIGSGGAFIAGVVAFKRKLRASVFFLLAFTSFLLSVIIYVFRTIGWVPYNLFTSYILELGSVIQITLLSLALADKINTYRRNQAQARREALRVSLENERLIKQQNIVLEEEVKVRTEELEQTNSELKTAMVKLQSTQTKLVETEKMASLGQLTAGIAHEINNPINFVTANIRPLEADVAELRSIIDQYEKLDLSRDISEQITLIEKYKKEIDVDYLNDEIEILLSGIKEGANRTSEIVKGLRSFARVDESNWKKANINEGVESTILLVKSTFPKNFELIKSLGDIPKIECAIGSINQLLMNIITNGVQAIVEKQKTSDIKGRLELSTGVEGSDVVIQIKDNGTGIPDEVRARIFDPFFTTKDVGEGTGLGLSIVQGIVEKHNGTIQVDSETGIGTTFIIKLPIR